MPWAKGHGAPAADVEAMVVACLTAIRGKLVSRERCATDAGAILGLWRALGRPELGGFGKELELVAEWARLSPDRLAARDIRAEGWVGGTDRHRSVATLCRRESWGDRLDAAQAWDRRRQAHAEESFRRPARAPTDPHRVVLDLQPDGTAIPHVTPQPRRSFDVFAHRASP